MAHNNLKWAAGVVLVAVFTGVGIARWATAGEPGSQPPGTSRATAPASPPDAVRGVVPPSDAGQPTVGSSAPTRGQQPNLSPTPPGSRPAPPPDLAPPQPSSPSFPQVGSGKQFIVVSPVGTWSREVVMPNGNNEDIARVTMKFEEDHLTIRVAMVVERQEVETVIEADYSITKDSVVFGVVTGSDVRVPAGGRLPAGAAGNEDEFVDQPFSFRFRADRGVLTVKDLRMPGVNKQGDAGLGQLLIGRFGAGVEEPAPGTPQTPGKSRPSVVPRRVLPPASVPSSSDSSFPQPSGPVVVPTGTPVGPVPSGYPH